ncbi:recombinase RecA [Meiothermus hypogaeus]|uniref:Protein RecA n=2 Tax=Meiothermus hypogaeus TaxID=884155 RepID=A0A511R1U9_9DEIN|nr:recombinase RecA [Meiothermus hypogaeus]RIH77019.1 Protein RecA [Meiothermus hypogaeus]GEM83574.1 protein RecA [Meiothermus hypogaeus NBRC 106114]GIW37434.1 MAG: protein RecA [Meiothermus sp.]
MDKEKQKALEGALKSIEKQFGKGAVMRLGEAPRQQVDVISTGSLGLDMALGIGGIPKGRIIEIYGPESGGKTTLALSIIAQAQQAGGVAAFVDAEHALDPVYAKSLGVNIDDLLVSQPDTGEQALEIVELLTRSGAIDVIVIDSVAALVPQAEIEGQMGDAFVGIQARLMSQALRKLTAALSKSNTAAIFINQIREKVGVMYGNPETTPGGRALKFYASVRLDVRKQGQPIKVGNDAVGNRVRVKVTKNKLAPPFREHEIELYFGKGIDPLADLVTVAIATEVVDKSGSWLSYGDTRLGQGKEKAAEFLKGEPRMAQEIREKVLAQAGKLSVLATPGEDEESSAVVAEA